jgi:hypothetical protein
MKCSKFTNIAGPFVRHHPVERSAGDARRVDIVFLAELRTEVLGQERNVSRPFAQGRHADREYVQAVVQILAERAVRDQFIEIHVCRGDQAEINRHGMRTAHAVNDAFLEHPQQLDLDHWRKRRHLIEEQRPT